jgi:N-acetylglucosamine-6-sulfatase
MRSRHTHPPAGSRCHHHARAMFAIVTGGFLLLTATHAVDIVESHAHRPSHPDIVVLMLDDTPPIHRLVNRMPTVGPWFNGGLRFDRYSGNDPLCCPGRAAFLSGQWSKHHRVREQDGWLFDPRMTIATQLDAVGYWTAFVGKYLNGLPLIVDKTPPGWDRTLLAEGHYYDYDAWRDGILEHHAKEVGDYSTDVYADAAVEVVRAAPAGAPVFLVLAPFATHAAAGNFPTAAPRHIHDARCDGIGVRAGPAYNEADISDKPPLIASQPLVPFPSGWPLGPACRSLLAVDEMFARVKAEFDRQGRTDVLWVLTADNGMAWGQHRWRWKQVAYATPMPLYIRWIAGRHVIDASVQNVDLAPTLAAVAGTSMGPYPNGHPRDGLDISSLLDGQGSLTRTGLYEERHSVSQKGIPVWAGWTGIRTTEAHRLGRWHWIEWADGPRELYDLNNDRSELANLAGAAEYASVRKALTRELAAMRGGP